MAAALAVLALAACAHAFSLSNTLGDHMVLQRDAASPPAAVWGFAAAGTTVRTGFNGKQYQSTTGADGVWRQALPATPAGGPYTLTFAASDGGSATLSDVLFGDVYLCSGQSNMQFTVRSAFNATEEMLDANNYPKIRVFTVGQGTSSKTPLTQLKTIEQQWAIASNSSIGGPEWGHFSAVCWFFGRDTFNGLGGQVPVGLISDNWGGTPIQHWSSPAALAKCNGGTDSVLWNAMMVPYTVGPMSLKGFTWYQGEANVGQTAYYACAFPAMIQDWRVNFNNPNAWFGFVQLAPWTAGAGTAVADMRTAQLAALAVPNVGYATAYDLGDATSPAGDIHPRNKQTVGVRLSNYALAQVYGQSTLHVFGTYKSATASVQGNDAIVTVDIDNAGSLALHPFTCPVPAVNCGNAFEVQLSDNSWVAATATVSGSTVTLTAALSKQGLTAIGSRYAQTSWPVAVLFSTDGLPVIPWSDAVHA